MEAQELLNVIDIIRNEKLYTERLAELNKVRESIKSDRYVGVTMEQADKYRNECEELKEQAKENLKCIEEEVESRVKARNDKLKEELSKVADERSRLEQYALKLDEEQKTLFKSIQNYKQLQENLRNRGNELSAMQKSAEQERRALATKIEQINRIFNQ